MNDPIAPLSGRAHVQNSAPVSVVFNPMWRSRDLVRSGGACDDELSGDMVVFPGGCGRYIVGGSM